MLVIDAGCYQNDTKEVFINFIKNKCKVEYIAVWHKEGGKAPAGNNFNDALKNGGGGNPRYLIKPDKSIVKEPKAADINKAGGNVQHTCVTSVADNAIASHRNIVLTQVNKKGFTVYSDERCVFSFSLYALNGQLISTVSKIGTTPGTHTFHWEKGIPSKGVYITTLLSGNKKMQQKVTAE